ncbi:hypothetical protein HDU92_000592 [Lobulomyces angularis]|nr:hypothetical protein HDU92_000592 [Lobulomyces angularis]
MEFFRDRVLNYFPPTLKGKTSRNLFPALLDLVKEEVKKQLNSTENGFLNINSNLTLHTQIPLKRKLFEENIEINLKKLKTCDFFTKEDAERKESDFFSNTEDVNKDNILNISSNCEKSKLLELNTDIRSENEVQHQETIIKTSKFTCQGEALLNEVNKNSALGNNGLEEPNKVIETQKQILNKNSSHSNSFFLTNSMEDNIGEVLASSISKAIEPEEFNNKDNIWRLSPLEKQKRSEIQTKLEEAFHRLDSLSIPRQTTHDVSNSDVPFDIQNCFNNKKDTMSNFNFLQSSAGSSKDTSDYFSLLSAVRSGNVSSLGKEVSWVGGVYDIKKSNEESMRVIQGAISHSNALEEEKNTLDLFPKSTPFITKSLTLVPNDISVTEAVSAAQKSNILSQSVPFITKSITSFPSDFPVTEVVSTVQNSKPLAQCSLANVGQLQFPILTEGSNEVTSNVDVKMKSREKRSELRKTELKEAKKIKQKNKRQKVSHDFSAIHTNKSAIINSRYNQHKAQKLLSKAEEPKLGVAGKVITEEEKGNYICSNNKCKGTWNNHKETCQYGAKLKEKTNANANKSFTSTKSETSYLERIKNFKKLTLCQFFKKGSCSIINCEYSHDLKIEYCKFFNLSTCEKGSACEFKHEKPTEEVLKNWEFENVIYQKKKKILKEQEEKTKLILMEEEKKLKKYSEVEDRLKMVNKKKGMRKNNNQVTEMKNNENNCSLLDELEKELENENLENNSDSNFNAFTELFSQNELPVNFKKNIAFFTEVTTAPNESNLLDNEHSVNQEYNSETIFENDLDPFIQN